MRPSTVWSSLLVRQGRRKAPRFRPLLPRPPPPSPPTGSWSRSPCRLAPMASRAGRARPSSSLRRPRLPSGTPRLRRGRPPPSRASPAAPTTPGRGLRPCPRRRSWPSRSCGRCACRCRRLRSTRATTSPGSVPTSRRAAPPRSRPRATRSSVPSASRPPGSTSSPGATAPPRRGRSPSRAGPGPTARSSTSISTRAATPWPCGRRGPPPGASAARAAPSAASRPRPPSPSRCESSRPSATAARTSTVGLGPGLADLGVDVVGKAEHPLGEDVALDLAGAATDGQGGGEQEAVVPPVLVALAERPSARP